MRAIRLAEAADGPEVAAIYGAVVAQTTISFETEIPTAQEMAQRIATALTFAPWLVYVEDGRVAGYAYASRHRERAAYQWSADASVYVAERSRGLGVGRALYTSLFALLRLQGFHAVHAGIALPNQASVRLHESFGFQPIGVYRKVGFKFGQWHDVGWWQLELRPRQGAPDPLVSLERLKGSPEWDEAIRA